jgi:hypothetical protein
VARESTKIAIIAVAVLPDLCEVAAFGWTAFQRFFERQHDTL